MKQTAKHALLWSVTAFIAVTAMVLSFFTYGPRVEALVKPLFVDIKGVYVDHDLAHLNVLVTGTKSRNCLLAAVYAQVQLDNGEWVRGEAMMLDRNGDRLTVENQRIAVGSPFVRLVNVRPGGAKVRLTAESRCHALWLSQQEFPEFTVTIPQ